MNESGRQAGSGQAPLPQPPEPITHLQQLSTYGQFSGVLCSIKHAHGDYFKANNDCAINNNLNSIPKKVLAEFEIHIILFSQEI